MRVAILQFAPRLGEPERNRAHADTLLSEAGLGEDVRGDLERENGRDVGLDLLVLPELAFSGYNFSSLAAIQPFLETTATGPSAQWAARTARRLRCCVAVGYPETTSTPAHVPSSIEDSPSTPALNTLGRTQNFNALVVVGPDGAVHAHYRKTHLYYTDATWAEPSPAGWQVSALPVPHLRSSSASPSSTATAADSTRTAFAICMDLNPKYFTAPWTAYEAASFVRQSQAPLLLASMAWLTSDRPLGPSDESAVPDDNGPDWPTLTYWLDRLSPLLWQGTDDGAEADTLPLRAPPSSTPETIVIVANRTGTEPGPCRACELDPAVRAATTADAASRKAAAQAATNASAAAAHRGAEPVAVRPSAATTNGGGPGEENPVLATTHGPSPAKPVDEDSIELGPIVSLEARYAGSSCVLGLGGGRARVWGVLGKAEEGVLRVDTAREPGETWRLARRGEDISSTPPT